MMWQEILATQCTKTGGVPPAQLLILSCRQPAAHSLSLGEFLHLGLTKSSCAAPVKGLEFWPPARDSSIIPTYAWTHSCECATWSSVVLHLGWALLAAMDLADGVVLVLGWAPPGVEEHCWLLSP